MNSYAEQKANLERQGWHIYMSTGGASLFGKKDISGLVAEVDQSTGAAKMHIGCPKYFADKHKPQLL